MVAVSLKKKKKGSHAPFFVQTDVTGDYTGASDASAMRAGAIGHGEKSVIEKVLTMIGPGQISFWWKVSSEDAGDVFRFVVDGDYSNAVEISGEEDWAKVTSASLAAGTHTLRWEYEKDNNGQFDGIDAGWIDDIKVASEAVNTFTPADVREIAVNGKVITLAELDKLFGGEVAVIEKTGFFKKVELKQQQSTRLPGRSPSVWMFTLACEMEK